MREGGEPELEAFFGGAAVGGRDGDGDGDERSGVMMSWSSEAVSNGPYKEGRRSQNKGFVMQVNKEVNGKKIQKGKGTRVQSKSS